MQFQIAAIAFFAGLAAAQSGSVTATLTSTDLITITSCAATITDCPARTYTSVYPVLTTFPVGNNVNYGGAAPSGTAATGNANYGTGATTYNMPQPTSNGNGNGNGNGYNGPEFTGAASSNKIIGGAFAGVAAAAALLI